MDHTRVVGRLEGLADSAGHLERVLDRQLAA